MEAYLSDNSILKSAMASPVLTLYTTIRILSSTPPPLDYSARIDPCVAVLRAIILIFLISPSWPLSCNVNVLAFFPCVLEW